MPEIRTLQADEYESLHRFLERSFGHGYRWFQRHQPDLARTDSEALDRSLVAIDNGQIVAHAGAFPLELAIGPARIMCGGIGNVATAPEARGRGHMSRLLTATIERMNEKQWPVSVLWGDRRRYGHFGWERCGRVFHVHVTRSGLSGVQPAKVEEVDPIDPNVAAKVAAFHEHMPYRVVRPDMAAKLKRPNIRLFVGPDGYVISHGLNAGNPAIIELASPTGRELELILATMDHSLASAADVTMEYAENERTGRILRVASHWNVQGQGMFRINDWPGFLDKAAPYLAERAVGLPSFAMAIGSVWQDETSVASVSWDGSRFETAEGRHTEYYVELDARSLTRLVFGGTPETWPELGLFQYVLPVPVLIPRLDYV